MNINRIETGRGLKQKRKKLEKTIEEMADENVSTATISNIERGLSNVLYEKINYYAQKLGIDLNDVSSLLDEQEKKEKLLSAKLDSILNSADLASPSNALKKLKNLKIDKSNNVYPSYLFLKGRCYFMDQKMSQAKRFYTDTLKIIDDYPITEYTNVKAFCYYDLGKIYHYENDFDNALSYNEEGIRSFNHQGDKTYLIHSLIIAKAIYLERLDRLADSLDTINNLWEKIDSIKNIYVLLNMYEVKSHILKKQKMFFESIKLAKEGIELALYNRVIDRSLDLWTQLGSTYLKIGDLEQAETALLTALDLEIKVDQEYLFANLYTLTGLLYMRQNRWDEAFQALNKAVQFGRKNDVKKSYTFSLMTLESWHQRKKQFSQAVENYQEASILAKSHGFKHLHHKILLELGRCFKEIDRDKFIQCLEKMFETEVELFGDKDQEIEIF